MFTVHRKSPRSVFNKIRGKRDDEERDRSGSLDIMKPGGKAVSSDMASECRKTIVPSKRSPKPQNITLAEYTVANQNRPRLPSPDMHQIASHYPPPKFPHDTENSPATTGKRTPSTTCSTNHLPTPANHRRSSEKRPSVVSTHSEKPEDEMDLRRSKSITEKLRVALSHRQLELKDFHLKNTVGTGTFGRVRIVRLRMTCSSKLPPLALKIVKKSEVVRLKQVEHIKAEKDILMHIRHPFVVNLLASFQDELRLYLLMEYVNGGELFSLLRKTGSLSADHSRFYTAQIVLAFAYLHAQNVAYRDLKPENLLLDSNGNIKITDFGFAKVVEDRTWTLCGTPEYLAPEVIQSKGHGVGVDWWALGVLIFEMMTGYPPFDDDNPMMVYRKILDGRFVCPRTMDVRAKDLIKRLLTHDRTKRYGCLRSGAEDIKRHKWFRGLDWDDMYERQITAPYVPEVNGGEDPSMFDTYPESDEGSSPGITAEEQRLYFDDF